MTRSTYDAERVVRSASRGSEAVGRGSVPTVPAGAFAALDGLPSPVVRAAERSKPHSVRPDIRLSVRATPKGSPGYLSRGLAPAGFRRSIGPPSFARGSRRFGGPWSLRDHAPLGGLAPLPRGRVRAPHRSDGDVSFLFQSQRSPAPGLRPVARPAVGGLSSRSRAVPVGPSRVARAARRRPARRGGQALSTVRTYSARPVKSFGRIAARRGGKAALRRVTNAFGRRVGTCEVRTTNRSNTNVSRPLPRKRTQFRLFEGKG